jgi:hypothetical protein
VPGFRSKLFNFVHSRPLSLRFRQQPHAFRLSRMHSASAQTFRPPPHRIPASILRKRGHPLAGIRQRIADYPRPSLNFRNFTPPYCSLPSVLMIKYVLFLTIFLKLSLLLIGMEHQSERLPRGVKRDENSDTSDQPPVDSID